MNGFEPKGTVKIENIHHSDSQIFLLFSFDRHFFTTSYWYQGLNLTKIRELLGDFDFERILFHIAAFEVNKICSFMPLKLDLSDYERFVDPAFRKLWTEIFQNVWAQWRYENQIFDSYIPIIIADGPADNLDPIRSELSHRFLNFCGQGKDSLVSLSILSKLQINFDNLFYSSSIYGTHSFQHQMSNEILQSGSQKKIYRQWVFEDFFESPLSVTNRDGYALTRVAAETPSSIFAAVPIAVWARTNSLVLGHEKSADTGQVIWEETGEDVNHQWGKSYQAEVLMNDYISENFIFGLRYFSILKPVYDTIIFFLLRDHMDLVPKTSSCNITKPWCGKCAKCAYVYMGYAAMLPPSVVEQTFPRNFLDDPDNFQTYREIAGLTGKLPFECIGQAEESKLMLHIIKARGTGGKILDELMEDIKTVPNERTISKYTGVYFDQSVLPLSITAPYETLLSTASNNAKQYICETLSQASSLR